nr:hypothetical protein [Janthinobacterium sp. FW305-129]
MEDPERRDPFDAPVDLVVGKAEGTTLLDHGKLACLVQAPSPGIVIFVHGVNSGGEWYGAAEAGLCQGLNTRMKRCDEHMAHATAQAGQLTPVGYRSELSDDGYVDPDYTAATFIGPQAHFSPVIQFRWGYKASDRELQQYGDLPERTRWFVTARAIWRAWRPRFWAIRWPRCRMRRAKAGAAWPIPMSCEPALQPVAQKRHGRLAAGAGQGCRWQCGPAERRGAPQDPGGVFRYRARSGHGAAHVCRAGGHGRQRAP